MIEEEHRVRAQSAEHLKRLLNAEDHRYLFTLIQKFRTEDGEQYPKLSDRSDIVVITDEAHRSQYDVFALNMRNALPNAAFIGFTGTPLMAGEERTKQVFGDYISIYNFKQSIDDGNTVPLYYENRIPELQLTNENLDERHGRRSSTPPNWMRISKRSWSGSSPENITSSPEKNVWRRSPKTSLPITRAGRVGEGDGHIHRQGHGGQDV